MLNTRHSICLIIICSVSLPMIVWASFSDVTDTHDNYEAINYVQQEGIVEGYPDGTYRPDNTINRAEFTKIIIGSIYDENLIDNCLEELHKKPFPDTPLQSWFSPFVCLAKRNDIIAGYPDGSFGPEATINFAETAKILIQSFQIDYAGVPGEKWYQKYIYSLERYDAIPSSINDPSNQVTRGEMAEMIYKLRPDRLPFLENKEVDNSSSASSYSSSSVESLFDISSSKYNGRRASSTEDKLYQQMIISESQVKEDWSKSPSTTNGIRVRYEDGDLIWGFPLDNKEIPMGIGGESISWKWMQHKKQLTTVLLVVVDNKTSYDIYGYPIGWMSYAQKFYSIAKDNRDLQPPSADWSPDGTKIAVTTGDSLIVLDVPDPSYSNGYINMWKDMQETGMLSLDTLSDGDSQYSDVFWASIGDNIFVTNNGSVWVYEYEP